MYALRIALKVAGACSFVIAARKSAKNYTAGIKAPNDRLESTSIAHAMP
jgi:hypothetical protein